MAYFVLKMDDRAIDELLNDIDGPVGQLLAELSEQITTVARAEAPVQGPSSYTRPGMKSTSYMPRSGGFTKGGTHAATGYDSKGRLFGGTNAPYAPTIWLEHTGRRANGGMRETHPFLTTGLYSVEL